MNSQQIGLQHLGAILTKYDQVDFKAQVTRAIEQLSIDELPLQQALAQSSVALAGDLSVMVLDVQVSQASIQLKAGIGFYGIQSGCSCADDPTPVDRVNEYGEFVFTLNRETGQTAVQLNG